MSDDGASVWNKTDVVPVLLMLTVVKQIVNKEMQKLHVYIVCDIKTNLRVLVLKQYSNLGRRTCRGSDI